MGKISKYGNIYDKHGNIIRKCNERGVLKNMTIQEVSDLVDKLGVDKDENNKIKDPISFNNASKILMDMYNNPKYSKQRSELIEKFNSRIKIKKEDVIKSLEETKEELHNNENKINKI